MKPLNQTRFLSTLACTAAIGLCACSPQSELEADLQDERIGNPRPSRAGVPTVVLNSIVQVRTPGGLSCSGTLYEQNKVVTAKHCADVPEDTGDGYLVELGPDGRHTRGVASGSFRRHPTADVLTLTLSSPAPSPTYVPAPIHPPLQDSLRGGDRVVIAGFGDTEFQDTLPNVFRWGRTLFNSWVPSYTDSAGRTYPNGLVFSAYFDDPDRADPANSFGCAGDSGGPVMQNRNGQYGLVGVMSAFLCQNELTDGFSYAADARALKSWIEAG